MDNKRVPREPFVLKAGESRRPGHLTMKATREDTLGAYALRENIAPPGFMVHPHRHQDTDEAWFLIDGELTFLGGSETFTLTTGGFIFVPRGHTHAFTNRAKKRRSLPGDLLARRARRDVRGVAGVARQPRVN